MDHITNKNILVLCATFYGYVEDIKNSLLQMGAKEVTVEYTDHVMDWPIIKRTHSLRNTLQWMERPNKRQMNTERILHIISEKRIDTFLTIEIINFNKSLFERAKEINPSIRFYWFIWDVMKINNMSFKDYIPCFHKVYTFDRGDAQYYGLEYLPNFCRSTISTGVSEKYDISYIGAYLPERIPVLSAVAKFCQQHHLSHYLHLKYSEQSGHLTPKEIFWRWYRRKDLNLIRKTLSSPWGGYLTTKSLSLAEVELIQKSSKVILDTNHGSRQGLSINAVNALVYGKKLITTNSKIKDEPFYHPNNIYVIDEQQPRLDLSFFETPYVPQDFSYLLVNNWLRHVLESEVQ